MSLVLLTRIDGIAVVRKVVVVLIFGKNRNKPRNIGKTLIPNANQRDPVLVQVKRSLAIKFVLLPMLQPIQEPVAIGGCEGHP